MLSTILIVTAEADAGLTTEVGVSVDVRVGVLIFSNGLGDDELRFLRIFRVPVVMPAMMVARYVAGMEKVQEKINLRDLVDDGQT